MAIFPNVYVAMVMISSMGIISMSISYCPYALLGQYHEMKEVKICVRMICIHCLVKKDSRNMFLSLTAIAN